MISRRDLNISVALGAGLTLLAGPASAESIRVLKQANGSGSNDASQCFITCGRHPRLKYYEAVGLDIDLISMSSLTQAMLSVMTRQVMYGGLASSQYLPAVAKDPSFGVIAAYNFLPRNANVVVVKADSPIKSISELSGKRVGIRSQGDQSLYAMKLMLTELGKDDSTVQYIPVGDVGPAALALKENRVDALASFDTAAARVELLGTPLRYLPLPPRYAALSAAWFGVNRQDLKENRRALVGVFRGIAKSTLFAYTNLDQAIGIHWQLYPETLPKNKSLDEAKKELTFLLKDRRQSLLRRTDDPDQRWGASNPEEWRQLIALAAQTSENPQLPQQIGDVNRVFTNELIDEVNAFDKAAVIKQAREFKL